MEFAGKSVKDSDVQYGRELANRLMSSETLPSDQFSAEVDLIRTEVDDAVEHNLDAAAAFVLAAAEACDSKEYVRNVYDFGRVAALVTIKITAKDPEIGKRLLHNTLTRHEPEFSNGVWAEILEGYNSGKLTYDDFNKFFLVRHLS